MRRGTKLVIASGLLGGAILFTPIGWVALVGLNIAGRESEVTTARNCQPAAVALARLCQSDPAFFKDEPPLAPAWTPAEVLKLRPTWVQITPGSARVEFGGGFHHFGYSLELDAAASPGGDVNHWALDFHSEDHSPRRLYAFTLPKSERLGRDEFVGLALAEFHRRAAQRPDDRQVVERIGLLLKLGEIERTRASVRDFAARYRNDWLDQLLLFMIDAQDDPSLAGARLDAWAESMKDYSGWMFAAYAYRAAGDADAAERCVTKAIAFPPDDPPWVNQHARYRGAAMGLYLYEGARHETCVKLCDALLAYAGAGEHLAPELRSLRRCAALASSGSVPDGPALGPDWDECSPFKGIDLARLRGNARPPATDATRPGLDPRDRTASGALQSPAWPRPR